ncbi:hypothetical protein L917_01530 [Phytophthora nicotianae]|uniref:PX domain-containing protein n=1 Tax=Phytophthora nicotianae TaxID=4792 RepID=W2LWX2_PHYNI|nr:hypothetical protein L917_01530 [Phytophthora nicotianae]
MGTWILSLSRVTAISLSFPKNEFIELVSSPGINFASTAEDEVVRSLQAGRYCDFQYIQSASNTSAPYARYTFLLTGLGYANRPAKEWKLWKRYSQCYAFRVKLRQQTRWDVSCLKERELFQPLIQKLQKVTAEFPRKYLGYDTDSVIQERRESLADYIASLFALYTDLDMLLASCVNEGVDLSPMLVNLEQFLEIPSERKAMEVQLTRSVLLLQDVDTVDPTAVECCICLSQSVPTDDIQITQLVEAVRSEMVKFTIAVTANKFMENGSLHAVRIQIEQSRWITAVIMKKRYSQCHELYLKLQQAVRCERLKEGHGEASESLTKTLKQLAGHEFPRKHARLDDEEIIHERCNKLAVFVLALLVVYAELDVLLSERHYLRYSGAQGDSNLQTLLTDIEHFLQIPPRWKEMKNHLVRSALLYQDEHANERNEEATRNSSIVQLKCGHIFS